MTLDMRVFKVAAWPLAMSEVGRWYFTAHHPGSRELCVGQKP